LACVRANPHERSGPAGSASAIERQQAEAAELAQLRRDNKRLKEEVEVLRKASAFFAQWAAKT
jgi:transposase-like protein